MTQSFKATAIGLAALLVVLLSVVMLERPRVGLEISDFSVGTTPVTLYQKPDSDGPLVVVAHGFAGSRQIMQAYSLHLAQSGYRVLAFDLEGHGRNPKPMSGDVTSVDGTTTLLVAETRAVIDAARGLPRAGPVALLGHSMATDIIIRAAIAEREQGNPVAAVVAISMFSEAISANEPMRLLAISGEWESRLRQAALDAVHLIDPQEGEGQLVTSGDVARLAVVAPRVEHVGVLFSPAAVDAATDWLDQTYDRQSGAGAGAMGLWILALLGGIVAGFYPLAARLPQAPPVADLPAPRFLMATIAPAFVAPLLITPFYTNFMPVLVADYLMIHLAVFGVLQLALSGHWRSMKTGLPLVAAGALAVWGILVFGLALDRYAASFWPTAERLPIIAILALGTIPFMLGDSVVTGAGRGALWRRVFARLILFASLIAAAMLDPEQLTFLVIVLPVFVLFFVVHGLMGRWVARRSGVLAAGIGLGLCLAWALGVSFPLFARG